MLVEEELRKAYPSHILPRGHNEWMFMNCGGWMGAIYLLHASVTEYVIFFGTGIDTSGHSGQSRPHYDQVCVILRLPVYKVWLSSLSCRALLG